MLIDRLLLEEAETILDRINEMVDQEAAREGVELEKAPVSRVRCPGCGNLVLREELLDKGCYVCGSLPSEGHEQEGNRTSFKVLCPGCGTTVVRLQLLKSGCYICGWQSADEDEG